jgi:hypothetical protein
MRKQDLPTIREIVDKNRKEREKERKKTKERNSVFRKKLNEY